MPKKTKAATIKADPKTSPKTKKAQAKLPKIVLSETINCLLHRQLGQDVYDIIIRYVDDRQTLLAWQKVNGGSYRTAIPMIYKGHAVLKTKRQLLSFVMGACGDGVNATLDPPKGKVCRGITTVKLFGTTDADGHFVFGATDNSTKKGVEVEMTEMSIATRQQSVYRKTDPKEHWWQTDEELDARVSLWRLRSRATLWQTLRREWCLDMALSTRMACFTSATLIATRSRRATSVRSLRTTERSGGWGGALESAVMSCAIGICLSSEASSQLTTLKEALSQGDGTRVDKDMRIVGRPKAPTTKSSGSDRHYDSSASILARIRHDMSSSSTASCPAARASPAAVSLST